MVRVVFVGASSFSFILHTYLILKQKKMSSSQKVGVGGGGWGGVLKSPPPPPPDEARGNVYSICEILFYNRRLKWNLAVKPVNNLCICRYISCKIVLLLLRNFFCNLNFLYLGNKLYVLKIARILIRGSLIS